MKVYLDLRGFGYAGAERLECAGGFAQELERGLFCRAASPQSLSLNDPTEVDSNEFRHQTSFHDEIKNFNDVSADDYLRGTAVVRIYSFADRHANYLFVFLLIPLIFSFFLRCTFGLFLLFLFPSVLLSRITHNLFSLSLRYQIIDCVASELSPTDADCSAKFS